MSEDPANYGPVEAPPLLDKVLTIVPVKDEYRREMVAALSSYFGKIQKWQKQIASFQVAGPDDVEAMTKAAEARKMIQAARIQAVDLIDRARKRLQDAMADTKNADTLWLRAKQNVEAECKALEAQLKEKEETRIRWEAQQKAEAKTKRTAEIQPYCERPEMYPLGEMSEGDFQNLKAVLIAQYNKVKEAEEEMARIEAAEAAAEKAKEEALRIENERLKKQQARMTAVIAAGGGWMSQDNCFVWNDGAGPVEVTAESVYALSDAAFEDLVSNIRKVTEAQIEEERRKQAEEEAARKQAEEQKAAREAWEREQQARQKSLFDLGLKFDGEQFTYKDINVHHTDILAASTEQWSEIYTKVSKRMRELKLEEAQQEELRKALRAEQPEAPAGKSLTMKVRLTAWAEGLTFPEPPGEYTGKGLALVKKAREGFEAYKHATINHVQNL